MEFLRLYGNKPEFRSDEFRNFLLESFTEAMAEDSDTVGDFVTICLEAFQDLNLYENKIAGLPARESDK